MIFPVLEHGPIPDSDRCAQEQVQIIGQIQPHGLLFALSEPDLIVRQVSANISTIRVPAKGGAVEVQCIAHRQDGVLIVEFELIEGVLSLIPLDFEAHIRLPLSRIRAASDVTYLSLMAASEVRRLSGFDRVMVYRFDKDWNGEVIAEAVGPSPVSYFGMCFPAGDIPPQVRRLFLSNVRRRFTSNFCETWACSLP